MSQTTLKRHLSFSAFVVIAVLIAGAPGVHAGEWKWEIAPYIWFPRASEAVLVGRLA